MNGRKRSVFSARDLAVRTAEDRERSCSRLRKEMTDYPTDIFVKKEADIENFMHLVC